ncbi:MAG TPA: SDR family oxidoreductase [Acidimicrobiales bacterium]|jgi:NAD(P)-dependent dehydrogenase (short-subunit alcohol dehydrogenase family)/pimeloyl-ACP methyl ester carboxylesterase
MTRHSHRVRSAGVELAVTDSGIPAGHPDAPTLILVHGYPDNSETWLPVVGRLESRYRVVTYDVRGAGASTAPKGRSGYTLDLLVEDLAAVMDTVSPHRPVHLVGHDWGSIQLWEAVTAEHLTHRIASFTSISGPCLDHVAFWVRRRLRPRLRGLRQLFVQSLRSWYVAAFHLPGAVLFWQIGGAGLVTRALRMADEWPDATAVSPTLASDGAHGINLYRANVLVRGARPRERRTDLPVQLIVPVGDRFVTPALLDDTGLWCTNLWRRDVPGWHWLIRHEPDRVARWISELIDHVEPPDPDPGSDQTATRSPLDRLRVGRELPDRGKVVVVTGAGSGIGRQTSLAFAERGAEIVAADIDADAAARTATLCRDLGAPATHHQVDVGDAEAMEALAKAVERDHGGADIVVNNAGIGMAGPLLDTSTEDWERVLRVNLWGVIHGSRLFGQQMSARGEGGHIVNVASMAAFTPSRSYPAYATSKAAVLMLSECLRAELADASIGVTAICPGVVNTGIVSATRFVGVGDAEQQRRRTVTNRLYARRGFTPEKVADAIVRSVDRNRPVVPVALEAQVMRLVSRLAPRTTRRLARIDPTTRL